VRRNSEYRPGSRKAMRPGESTTQGDGAESAKLPFRIPPLSEVHLTDPYDDDPQAKEAVKVDRRDCCFGHAKRQL
jgi:hypothetical protein